MSLQERNFTELTSPSARYLDEFLTYNQKKVRYEQGLDLMYMDALSAPNDAKINNYSGVYLTNLMPDSQIFSTNTLERIPQNIITYIATLSVEQQYLFLDFDINTPLVYNSGTGTPPYTDKAYTILLSSQELELARIHFQIEILPNNVCRIKHNYLNTDYYLVYDRFSPYTTNFYFTTSIDVDSIPDRYNSAYKDAYDYILDQSGYMYLTKWVNGQYYFISVSENKLQLNLLTSSAELESKDSLFKLLITDTELSPKLNSSWVSYKTDEVDQLYINPNKSITNLKNNNLLHFQYEDITSLSSIDVSVIKLKNAYTDRFVSKRGNCGIDFNANIPVPFFREYTNIYTGGDQEAGYRDLVLNYVFYNYDLKFEPGTRTEFTTPSSMFPYSQLNVNETNFFADGALGFNTPELSDKITTKNSINQADEYGSYLTTWLSGSTWLDRYYFPDIITRQQALSGNPVFDPTFANPISKVAYATREKIKRQQYFDVKSDLSFYPNETYYYERISLDTINTYVNNIADLTQVGFAGYTLSGVDYISTTPSLKFENNTYSTLSIEPVNRTGSFTMFFTLENDFNKRFSYILGNLVNTGFGIYSDFAITPIMYIKSGKVLNAYNTDSSILYSLSFDEVINDVVDSGGLNDFHIVTDQYVYNVATDGTIVGKVFVDGLSGYKDYHHYDGNIYFLKNDGLSYIEYNTSSFNYITGGVTIFASNGEVNRGIYYHKGVVYGFENINLKKDSRNYLYGLSPDGDAMLRYDLDEPYTLPVVFLRGNTILNDYNIDREDNVWVLHNNSRLTKVDKNRKFVSDLSFTETISCYNIDFVNEYRDGANLFYPVVLGRDAQTNVYTINDISFERNSSQSYLAIVSGYDNDNQNVTGFNAFIDNKDYENLNFELRLTNIFNYLDEQNFKFTIPLNKLSKFANTFCYSYSNDGNLSLYLNGDKIKSAIVENYKYIGNIFMRDNMSIGTIPFHNNTVLESFLGIKNYGNLDNTTLSNFRFYNRGLSDNEIKSLYLLQNSGVDTLYTSLPCGQRNNYEEIQSIIKLAQPIAKSNVIDVIVQNSGISDKVLQNQLATGIVADIGNTLPGDVTVRDVKFINY